MGDAIRRTLCLAIISVTLVGCSVSSPVLRPPAGRGATEVSRDMAECEAASTPGVGTYATAAGQGLLARIVSPFVGIWPWSREARGRRRPRRACQITEAIRKAP
jgi:hypothetical protein